jgi:flavin reductase (DIM6/NTAB) family NADH-FMN oxidoreductase RutF
VTSIDVFRCARYFAINVLRGEDQDLAERFARRGEDRFDGIPWKHGIARVPILSAALASLECAVYRRIPCGDHDIFVGEVLHVEACDGAPLVYFSGRYRALAVD